MGYFPGDELSEPGPSIPGFHYRVNTEYRPGDFQKMREQMDKFMEEHARKSQARYVAKETLRKALAGIEADDAKLGMPELSALLRLVLDEF